MKDKKLKFTSDGLLIVPKATFDKVEDRYKRVLSNGQLDSLVKETKEKIGKNIVNYSNIRLDNFRFKFRLNPKLDLLLQATGLTGLYELLSNCGSISLPDADPETIICFETELKSAVAGDFFRSALVKISKENKYVSGLLDLLEKEKADLDYIPLLGNILFVQNYELWRKQGKL